MRYDRKIPGINDELIRSHLKLKVFQVMFETFRLVGGTSGANVKIKTKVKLSEINSS